MHFVSAQSEEEQIEDIIHFLQEHMRDSLGSSAHSLQQEDFEIKLNNLAQKQDYLGILDYLLDMREVILQLPIQHKNSALTIQRIVLLVLPLLKCLDDRATTDKETRDLKTRIIQICKLIEESQYPLSIKVNSVLHIFSIFDEESKVKGIVFQRLFELCDNNGQLKIIVENLKNVEDISKSWKMLLEERRALYKSCALTLDRNHQHVAAFNVMVAFLKLFENSNDQELAANNIENEAKRCVLLGVQVPTVIDFADILNLKAVKYLQGKNKTVFDFMSLFTSTNAQEFEQKVKGFTKLIEEENLSIDDVIKKKQYISICSLKLDNSNQKYSDLSKMLNIKMDDVEAWAIEAIASGIIDAKIDQLNEEIVIKSHIMNQELTSIKERLGEWKYRFAKMQEILSKSQQTQ